MTSVQIYVICLPCDSSGVAIATCPPEPFRAKDGSRKPVVWAKQGHSREPGNPVVVVGRGLPRQRKIIVTLDNLRPDLRLMAATAALVNYAVAMLDFYRDVEILQVRPDGMWQL